MKSRSHFVGAVVLTMGLLVHCAVTHSWPRPLLLFHGAWILVFVLLGLGARWLSLTWTSLAASITAFVGLTGFVLLSGGADGPYFSSLFALPFLQTVYWPDSRPRMAVCSVSSLLALLFVTTLGGDAPRPDSSC